MANLTTQRDTPKKQTSLVWAFPVAQDAVLPKGTLAFLSSGRYAAAGAGSTAQIGLGRVKKSVDNTGGSDGLDVNDAPLSVEVEEGIFLWANGDSIAQADVGKRAYSDDNQTAYKGSSSKSFIGVIAAVDANGVWVYSSPALAMLAVAVAADSSTVSSDLASTSTGKGASLVGIEDAASLFTADDVEAALAELAGYNVTKIQKITGTLSAGSLTVSTGIAVTANTRVVGIVPTARGGTFPAGGFQSLSAGNTVGGAGTGAVTITARKADGTLENACTDTIAAILMG